MKTITQLKSDLGSGVYDVRLSSLYGSSALQDSRDRYAALLDRALALWGDQPACFVSAPGRTEIGGNHTDHQNGRVLAGALSLDVVGVVVPTEDNTITYMADDFAVKPVNLDDLSIHPEEKNTSEALIRGIASRFHELGHSTGGFKCFAESRVLPGSGMSSSAAFEVLIGTVLSQVFNEGNVSAVDIARIGQYAENVYFMKNSGLMDQMASSVGGFVAIDFANPEQPVIENISFDMQAAGYDLIITDSKASHADLSDEYSEIPDEMKAVAHLLHEDVLSKLTIQDLLENASLVRRTCGDRAFLRAFHFFHETERAKKEKEALQNDDLSTFLTLVKESGRSSFMYLQNVKVNGVYKEEALAVALALSEEVLGSDGAYRVHGGGFAGTIQAFCPHDLKDAYISMMESVFGKGCCVTARIRKEGGTVIF